MAWPMIAELADAERPREKMRDRGAVALSDAELLGIVLGSGYEGVSAVELGRQLLAGQGHSLALLAQAEAPVLSKTKGIGPARACALQAVFELARRVARAEHAGERQSMADPARVARHIRHQVQTPLQEEFHVLLLDSRNQLAHGAMVSRGILDRTSVHPREVFRLAITHGAAKVVVAHNHPSGDPSPSAADLDITRALVAAGAAVGIELMDHVIVGSAVDGPLRFASLREMGRI